MPPGLWARDMRSPPEAAEGVKSVFGSSRGRGISGSFYGQEGRRDAHEVEVIAAAPEGQTAGEEYATKGTTSSCHERAPCFRLPAYRPRGGGGSPRASVIV